MAIEISDHDKAVDFYRNVLGMEKTKSEKGETYLKCGPMNFCVGEGEGRTFFEFKVDSVPEARKLLEDNGCKVTQVYNEKSVMIADPYGFRFHIWEEGAFPE